MSCSRVAELEWGELTSDLGIGTPDARSSMKMTGRRLRKRAHGFVACFEGFAV
jgi:hypothetical protein